MGQSIEFQSLHLNSFRLFLSKMLSFHLLLRNLRMR